MDIQQIKKEIKIRTVRSSGSGGQHVNKVETKVELILDIDASEGLNDIEKQRIHRNIKHRINKENELIISDQSTRSQLLNRKSAFRKLERLLNKALLVRAKRKGSGKLKADKEKRLKNKRLRSEVKKMRGKVIMP